MRVFIISDISSSRIGICPRSEAGVLPSIVVLPWVAPNATGFFFFFFFLKSYTVLAALRALCRVFYLQR
jgi:hypothetical protein